MWCVALLFFILVLRTQGAPLSNEKAEVLFTCPPKGECFASPRNCVDDCNAAFSMWHEKGRTTFNITMLSGLGYVALLIKDPGPGRYDKAIVCSFHQPRGIVARVDYPDPIVIHEFIETSEPEGNTDSLHTQCSMSAEVAMPSKAQYKLMSGKWESELILDERLAIDVVPAVENARILSTNEQLSFPASKRRKPAVRASTSKEVDLDKASERKQFEKKAEEEKANKLKEMKKRIEEEEGKKIKQTKKEEDDEKDDDDSEEATTSTDKTTGKDSKSKGKETKVKEGQSRKNKDQSKNVKSTNDDDNEDDDEDEDEETTKKTKKDKGEERPRYREYEDEEEDEDDHDHNEKDEEDADDAPSAPMLISITLPLVLLYL